MALARKVIGPGLQVYGSGPDPTWLKLVRTVAGDFGEGVAEVVG